MNTVRRFLADETAATAIEYGLIAAGIAAVIVLTVNSLGEKVNATFDTIKNNMVTAKQINTHSCN